MEIDNKYPCQNGEIASLPLTIANQKFVAISNFNHTNSWGASQDFQACQQGNFIATIASLIGPVYSIRLLKGMKISPQKRIS